LTIASELSSLGQNMAYRYTINAKDKGSTLKEYVYKPNDRILIRWISGLWSANPAFGYYDAIGDPAGHMGKDSYLYPGDREGALIAVIGIPAFWRFYIGNYNVIHNPNASGQLWVAINDDWTGAYGPGYADNDGSIVIEVSYASEVKDLAEKVSYASEVKDPVEKVPSRSVEANS
jgi:hypothetical protein